MDFARSVAHLSILNPGAPTGCTDNILGGSDISNLEKKCPLCAFNATGGQITVKSIQGLYRCPLKLLFGNTWKTSLLQGLNTSLVIINPLSYDKQILGQSGLFVKYKQV